MMTCACPFSAKSRATKRGFTLTELAIVLGIIGIILGAIWAAAAMVYENNRTKQAVEETLAIVNNWHSVYGTRRVDISGDMTAITISNNFETPEMLLAVTAHGVTTDSLVGPWSTSTVTVAGDTTNNGIQLVYAGLSESACNHYGNAISQSAGLLEMQVNSGTTYKLSPLGTDTITTSEVNTGCSLATGNTVTVLFAMN